NSQRGAAKPVYLDRHDQLVDRVIDKPTLTVEEVKQEITHRAARDERLAIRFAQEAAAIKGRGGCDAANRDQHCVEIIRQTKDFLKAAALYQCLFGGDAVHHGRGGNQISVALEGLRETPGKFGRIDAP